MKRLLCAIIIIAFCLSLSSCSSASDLYGVWYADEGGVRNAVQFSENKEGKDVFVWAAYNIKDDSIESNTTGYYKVSGDTVIFDTGDRTEIFELQYEISDDTLVLFSESARLTLEKYVLED